MIDPRQHSEQRNPLEAMLRLIPGFRGYLEKDYRQESDRLARVFLADRLQQARRALDEHMRRLLDEGKLDALPALERLKTRLESVILKMRAAVRGYSGFFDYVRVDTRLLDAVYEHDMSLLQDVDALVRNFDQLGAQPELANQLPAQVEGIDRKFAQRGDLLKGVGTTP
jgi:hypothetical protein